MLGKNSFSQTLYEVTARIEGGKHDSVAQELKKIAQSLDEIPGLSDFNPEGSDVTPQVQPAVNVEGGDMMTDPYSRTTKNYGNSPEDTHVIEFEFKVPAGTDKDYVLNALKDALSALEKQQIEYVKATFKKKKSVK